MKGLIAIIAAAALAAPASAAGPQKRLDAARAKWADGEFRHYRFHLEVFRFRANDAYDLVVRRRKPVDPPREIADVSTVPRLFREIQRALDADYAKVEVSYGRTGFPRRVFFDQSERLVDDTISYVASRLRRG